MVDLPPGDCIIAGAETVSTETGNTRWTRRCGALCGPRSCANLEDMTVTVRSATKADIRDVADVLAQAFYDDPVMQWMLPDDARRLTALRRLYIRDLRFHHLSAGEVDMAYGDDGLLGGVAAWNRPGHWHPSTWQSLRSLPAVLWALGGRIRVGAQIDGMLTEAHPRERHWYLESIGTDPQVRGGGFGKALLGKGLARCDEAGLPAYLESSKEANIPYYERFGFVVQRELAIPDGGPTLYAMWRKPQ